MRRVQPLLPVVAFIISAAAASLLGSRALLALTPLWLVALPFVLARRAGRPSDPLEPIWLLGGLLFFGYAVVGGLQLWDVERFMSLPGFLRLDGPHYAPTMWLGGLGFVALCVGYELGTGHARTGSTVRSGAPLVWLCVFTGAILVVYGILAVETSLLLVEVSDYSLRTILTGGLRDAMFLALPGRGYLSVGFSALSLGGPCLCLALVLRAREVPRLRRWVLPAMAATAVVSAIVFVAILGSRQLMMATLIELLAVYHFAYERIRTRTAIALATVLATLGVTFISVRNRGSLTFDPLEAAGLASRTFDGFNFLLAAVSRHTGHFWGQTLLEDLVYTYLPRALFPDKPTVFGIISGQDAIIPGLSASVSSGTFPPGILAEGYLNFGVAGVMLLPLMLGFGARALHRRAALGAPFFVLAVGWLLGNAVGVVRGLGSVLPALATVTILLSPLLVPAPFERLRRRATLAAIGGGTLAALAGLALIMNPVVTPESIAASGGRGALGRHVPATVLRSENRGPSLLVMWASWCNGCPEQLRRVAAVGRGSDVSVFGVAYQDDPRAAKRIFAATSPRGVNTLDDGPIVMRLGTNVLPTTYLVNDDRRIACALAGPTDGARVRAALDAVRRSGGRPGPC